MRAIIINSQDRTITEAEIGDSLESLERIVGGPVESEMNGLDQYYHHCYVHEDGVTDNPVSFFMFKDGRCPFAGNGVILSWSTVDGSDADCTLPFEWVKERVTFMGVACAIRWFKEH